MVGSNHSLKHITVEPALVVTWIQRSLLHCSQLGEVPNCDAPFPVHLHCYKVVTCLMHNTAMQPRPNHNKLHHKTPDTRKCRTLWGRTWASWYRNIVTDEWCNIILWPGPAQLSVNENLEQGYNVVKHPPTCTSIYHSQGGFKSAFALL